jgi:ribosomal protein S18 acetylase RimI-like enzyme
MSAAVRLAVNRATAVEIADHLRACDADFLPRLTDRVEINGYANKLVDRAQRFEAWSGTRLVGLVAAYCDDPDRDTCWITSVSVDRDHRGSGLGRALLDQAIELARTRSFRTVSLEVGQSNHAARRLYTRMGFATVGDTSDMVRMDMTL